MFVLLQISNEVANLPQSRFLPRPPGHEKPLLIDMPKFSAAASDDWLRNHGLKGMKTEYDQMSYPLSLLLDFFLTATFFVIAAKSLDLYQVLAPNAFSYREEFIPVIRKTVQSQVHEVGSLIHVCVGNGII